MEAEILTPLVTAYIPGSEGKYARVVQPFRFRSKVLYDLGLEYEREAPIDFVFDFESVPWFRGSCPEGGGGHDLACRKDFDPSGKVTKKMAADIYLELMKCAYSMNDESNLKGRLERFEDMSLEYIKYSAVVVWPGYFHKHNIMASYEEMAGITMT